MKGHRDHPHSHGLPTSREALYRELAHHLPFSVSAVALGLTFAGLICFLAPVEFDASHADHERPMTAESSGGDQSDADHDHDHDHDHEGHVHENPLQDLFHLFHPMHMLFSAAATTAMFWRYERKVAKAVIVGLIGAIGVCGLSDIVMPHLSLTLLGMSMPWHICVIEHPQMVISFAAIGILVGLGASAGVHQSTFFSHSLHVLSSSMASIFYLIGPFSRLGWIDSIGVVFLFIVLAVMIPCCLSDIVFPTLLARSAQSKYASEHDGCGA